MAQSSKGQANRKLVLKIAELTDAGVRADREERVLQSANKQLQTELGLCRKQGDKLRKQLARERGLHKKKLEEAVGELESAREQEREARQAAVDLASRTMQLAADGAQCIAERDCARTALVEAEARLQTVAALEQQCTSTQALADERTRRCALLLNELEAARSSLEQCERDLEETRARAHGRADKAAAAMARLAREAARMDADLNSQIADLNRTVAAARAGTDNARAHTLMHTHATPHFPYSESGHLRTHARTHEHTHRRERTAAGPVEGAGGSQGG